MADQRHAGHRRMQRQNPLRLAFACFAAATVSILVLVRAVPASAAFVLSPEAAKDLGKSQPAQAEAPNGGAAGSGQQGGSQPGSGQRAAEDQPNKGWFERQFDGIKQWFTERIGGIAVNATAYFVRTALTPTAAEILLLRSLVTDRSPPGTVSVIRNLWANFWWGAVGVVLVAALIQAIRIAAAGDGNGDENGNSGGRSRWTTWLIAPLAGIILARVSLFAVDLTVAVQNLMWKDALSGFDPCAVMYASCPDQGGQADLGKNPAEVDAKTAFVSLGGVAVSLVMFILQALAVLVFLLLYGVNWLALAMLGVIGPIYIALTAAGRTLEPVAGWFGLLIRTTAMQTVVGFGISIIMAFQEAGTTAEGGAKVLLTALNSSGVIRFAVIVTMILILVFWWLLPMLSAAMDMVTLKGGETLASAGRFALLAGGILTGAGAITGSAALSSFGQRAAGFGMRAAMAGGLMSRGAKERRQAMQEHGVGGWIARATGADATFQDVGDTVQTAGERAAMGLPPVPPYRVRQAHSMDGSVDVSAAPGLAAAVVRSLSERGMDVDVGDQEFAVDAQEEVFFWDAVIQAVTGGPKGVVRRAGRDLHILGLNPQTASAVQAALAQQGIAYTPSMGGAVVSNVNDPQTEKAVRLAVAQGILAGAYWNDGSRFRFRLDGIGNKKSAETLTAMDRAGIRVTAMDGPFTAKARLRGQKAKDAAAAAEAAQKALAETEKEVLEERPGYYRHGNEYLIVEYGKPMRKSPTPPHDGVFLGDWPGRP